MSRWIRICSFILALCELPAFADEPQAAVISFDVERPGRVSAAVYDAEGKLVRELLQGTTVSAGTQTVIWDGLGRNGESLPAGEYTWKSLETPGLKAKYLLSVGTNFPPGTEWNTACGPGTHEAPFGVAGDFHFDRRAILVRDLDGDRTQHHDGGEASQHQQRFASCPARVALICNRFIERDRRLHDRFFRHAL